MPPNLNVKEPGGSRIEMTNIQFRMSNVKVTTEGKHRPLYSIRLRSGFHLIRGITSLYYKEGNRVK